MQLFLLTPFLAVLSSWHRPSGFALVLSLTLASNPNSQPQPHQAVDMQLFLLTPFLAVLASWHRPSGFVVVLSLTLASLIYCIITGLREAWSVDLMEQTLYNQNYYTSS